MRLLPTVLLTLFTSWSGFGQTYTISTFAGGALPVNILGTSASMGPPQSVAVDTAGNVFFVIQDSVLRLDAVTSILTAAAGNGTGGYSGDNGAAINAQLLNPVGVAVDFAGNLYIADLGNNRVRKVSNGVITTVAGNGTQGFSGDGGPAINAQLNAPAGVAVDPSGNLYISDDYNNRVRRVSNGVITTVVGNGAPGFSGDNGLAINAQLNYPNAVAADLAGNLYITDVGNQRIRKVSNGIISTVAGNGTQGFSGDGGPATSAQLSAPQGIAVDSQSNLYIADVDNERIRKVSNGVIATIAGEEGGGFSGDGGPATNANLYLPQGVAVDSVGNLYIADWHNYRIRKVSNGVITTVAGNGACCFSGDNGPASSAQLYLAWGVAVDSARNVYIADSGNDRIRKVSNGVITTIAGNGTFGFSGDDGPATSAQLYVPTGVAVDSAGNIYLVDSLNGRIREVSDGVISTIAGNGTQGFSGDGGPATSAQFFLINTPSGIALNRAGNLYVADQENNRIRKISNGVITTVAGNGTQGFSGDGGPANAAQLSLEPGGNIALDSAGNLYIGDAGNLRIRKVADGVITTVAGGGSLLTDGVAATSAQIYPLSVAVDSAGDIYIGGGNLIRKVSNGVIFTIAGNGNLGFSGDGGPATSAQLSDPVAVAVDSAGSVYVADSGNNRIRLLTPSASSCTYSVSPTTWQAPTAGGSQTFTIQTDASCSWTASNLPSWLTVSGASSGSGSGLVTLIAAANSGSALSATISIAGVSVNITQAASPPPCTYSISPGGQSFPASGGSGNITITAGAGCTWSVATTLNWVSFTSATSGTGNGTVTFQAAANTGAARSGSFTIGGAPFTVEEATASVSGFSNAGSMAQIASAGSWTTTFTLVNTGSTAVEILLNFFDNNGNPLPLSLTFPQSPNASGPELAATLDRIVNPGAELVIQTTGPTNQSPQVGWAQLLANGTIGGFAVFSQAIGSSIQDGEVPLETRNSDSYVLSFDNTNGSATGVALANIASQAVTTTITVRDDTGAVLLTNSLDLPAMGHTSFNLTDQYPSTAQRRGTVQFTTPSAGQISVLGLNFNVTGAFSTIPALSN